MDRVEVKYKKWVRIGTYVLTPFFLALCIYMLTSFLLGMQEHGLPFFLDLFFIAVSSIGVLACIFNIPHVYKMRVIVDSEGIAKQGLLSREIAYDDIEKIKVGNGMVKVVGGGMFDTITIGDLFTHFEKVVKLLSKNIENHSDITVKGKDKYTKEYFARS
jgi:hypothetical protein